MDNFKRALAFTLKEEGGYAHKKNDKGGETMMGITAGTLARAYKAGLVSCDNVKALTRDDAEEIYRCFYWQPSKAPSMPWPLCAVHFDAAVNHGTGGAVQDLTWTAQSGRSLKERSLTRWMPRERRQYAWLISISARRCLSGWPQKTRRRKSF